MSSDFSFKIYWEGPKQVVGQVMYNGEVVKLQAKERRVIYHLWEHGNITVDEVGPSLYPATISIARLRTGLIKAGVQHVVKTNLEDGKTVGWSLHPPESNQLCCPFCKKVMPRTFTFFEERVYWGEERLEFKQKNSKEILLELTRGYVVKSAAKNITDLRSEFKRWGIPYSIRKHHAYADHYVLIEASGNPVKAAQPGNTPQIEPPAAQNG